jgi:hypothetical protein
MFWVIWSIWWRRKSIVYAMSNFRMIQRPRNTTATNQYLTILVKIAIDDQRPLSTATPQYSSSDLPRIFRKDNCPLSISSTRSENSPVSSFQAMTSAMKMWDEREYCRRNASLCVYILQSQAIDASEMHSSMKMKNKRTMCRIIVSTPTPPLSSAFPAYVLHPNRAALGGHRPMMPRWAGSSGCSRCGHRYRGRTWCLCHTPD